MLFVIDRKFLWRHRLERPLADRRRQAELQVRVEPAVHHFTAYLVVVVAELRQALRHDAVVLAI
jgi:hypothetical protein